ncbi:MAG: dihydrolipoyl dehydrogenase [Candidatus Eisenbacteria bacterium]
MADRWDVAILGGGPGGYVAAIRAAQLGLKTVCIESTHLGGICLNWGCIPTKALLKNAEVYSHLTHGDFWGIKTQGVAVDWPAIIKRSRDVADRLNKGVGFLFKKYKVDYIAGRGTLTAADTLEVTEADGKKRSIQAGKIILATGGRARQLPGVEFDSETILSSKEAMVLPSVPKSMLIVGAGAIGVEFAYLYQTFGCEITLVEMLPNIVPIEDTEVSQELEKLWKKRGMNIHTGSKVKSLVKKKGGVVATLETPSGEVKVEAEKALIAIGVQGNIENIGLEKLGVKTDRSFIVVDKKYQTNVPGVLAIGDVIGPPLLAHVASAEGVAAVTWIAGKEHPAIDYGKIPGCTYCQPQVASIGLTERAAKEKGIEVKIGRFPFRASGKSLAIGETDGFVKVIFDAKYGGLIGAHILGSEATEMIAEAGLGLGLETTQHEILDTIHAHPTLAESFQEAVAQAYNESLAI